MNRSQFVRAVARNGYSTVAEVNDILRSIESVIVTTIGRGEDIQLFGGFKLESVFTDARKVWNPKEETFQDAPPRYRCKLRTTPSFNERINYGINNE